MSIHFFLFTFFPYLIVSTIIIYLIFIALSVFNYLDFINHYIFQTFPL